MAYEDNEIARIRKRIRNATNREVLKGAKNKSKKLYFESLNNKMLPESVKRKIKSAHKENLRRIYNKEKQLIKK